MSETAPKKGFLTSIGLGKKEFRAWAMYDWANSAFATTVMAGFLPIYYRTVAASGFSEADRTAMWGYTQSVALLVIAVISPILGAVADYMGAKKRFLAVFMGFGATFCALLYMIGEGDWLLASAIFIVARIGFAGGNAFYESLLPSMARKDELDRVSTAGYAVGYVGGGVLLAINVAWFMMPEAFGFTDANQAVRASFVSVGVWWVLFSIPLFRHVPEPRPRLTEEERAGMNPLKAGFSRVGSTLREMGQHRELFLFLLAFLIYNDGVNTIISMATAYGSEVGIAQAHLIGVLLMVQFVGMPATFAFGHFASKFSAKSAVYFCLVVYTALATFGFFMNAAWQFWVLGAVLAMVQGGVQALSRSIFASMVPVGRSTEFFGFYSVAARFAGIFGPLVFAVVGQAMESSRYSILSLIAFFAVGGLLLTRVDIAAGQVQGHEDDSEMHLPGEPA
jgi:UMF1 family MFS transporter